MREPGVVMGPLLQLKLVSGLETLGSGLLATLARETEEVLVRRGTTLQSASEPVQAMHFLVDGRVRIVRGAREVEEGPGGAVGLLEVLAGETAGAEARAVTDIVALRLDGDVARELMELHFPLLAAFLTEVAGRVSVHPEALALSLGAGDSVVAEQPSGGLDRVARLLALHRSPAFPSSSMDALSEVSDHAREVTWGEGEELWTAGSPSSAFYVVCAGAVDYAPTDDRAPLRLGPGSAPGLVAMLSGVPRRAGAHAAREVVALEVEREGFFDVLEDHFEMAMGMLSRLAGILLTAEGVEVRDYGPEGGP